MKKKKKKKKNCGWLEPDGETNLFTVFGDSCSQRVFTVVFSCTHDGQQAGARHPIPLHNYLNLDNLRGTIRDGPGLVEHH